MKKIFVGKLVLTDYESSMGPAVIVVKDGKITKVIKGTTNIPDEVLTDNSEVISLRFLFF